MNSTKTAALFLVTILLAVPCASGAEDANEPVVKDADSAAAGEPGEGSKPMAEKASAFDVNSLKTPAFRPPADEKKARLWALACAGILMERNGDRHDVLETGPMNRGGVIDQKKRLSEWWGVESRQGLIECLRGLEKGGHRASFEADVKYITGGHAGFLDMLSENRNKDRANELKIARQYYKQLGAKGILGWDYSRYICLCRWGYMVGYLSEDEAWEKIMPVARGLQKKFGSWKELGENYLIGRQYWSGKYTKEDGYLYDDALTRLLEGKTSPWMTLPWNTDLGDGPVMGEPWSLGRTIVVGKDARSIAGAMEMAKANDTVYARAGLYMESGIKLKDGVRLMGDGMGSTIISAEPNNGVWIIRADGVRGRIEGLTVEHKGAKQVWRNSGGIQVLRSKVEVVSCEAKNTSGYGIVMSRCVQPVVENCVATDNMGGGIFIKGAVLQAKVIGCFAKGNKRMGIVVGSDANSVIERNMSRDNDMTGISATGNGLGKAIIRENRVIGNKSGGIGAGTMDSTLIERNICEDNAKGGIYAYKFSGKAVITDNKCGGNKGSGIQAYMADAEISENQCDDNVTGIYVRGCPKATIAKNNVTGSTKVGAINITSTKMALVTENVCTDNDVTGIVITANSQAKVEDNRCIDNDSDGILLNGGAVGSVTHNWCEGNKSYGIAVYRAGSGVTMTGNRCVKNAISGVLVNETKNVSIKDNQFHENASYGMWICHGSRVKADGNSCQESGQAGIYISDANTVAMLKWNKCLNNRRSGISFESGAGGETNGNMCSENGWCGIGARGTGTAPILKANRCNDNGAWGIVTWAGAKLSGLPGDNTAERNYRGNVMERE